MRFGLQTWGSHGDVEPFLALAHGLVEAGHEACLVVTTQADKELVAPPGVELRRIGAPMSQGEGDALFDRIIALSSPMAQGKMVLEEGFLPFADAMYDAARELVADCDVVVRHHFLYMTQVAAKLAGIPEVSVFLTPDLLPTREHPPTGMPSFGPLQGVAWWLANKGISGVFGPPAQALRKREGLESSKGVLHDVWVSPTANLVAVSPALFERPEDWPRTHHLTGFWRAPSSQVAEVEPSLDAFIDAGAPPVFATFGSMGSGTGARRESDVQLLTDAAREAGVRLVLQLPPGPPISNTSDDVFSVGRAPHARVFPRCAAVVHHGGAGTTQTTVSAGVPSVVVPHLADQFFWASQVERLGVGAATRGRAKVRSDELAAAIQAAISGDAAKRATDLSATLASETGVSAAVDVLQTIERARPSA